MNIITIDYNGINIERNTNGFRVQGHNFRNLLGAKKFIDATLAEFN
jgi:hypothetical protein